MKNKTLLLPLFILAIGISAYRSFDSNKDREVQVDRALPTSTSRGPAQTVPSSKSKVSKIQSKIKPVQFDLEDYHARLLKIKSCYSHENCRYDNSDPRAYEFAVGKDLAQKLNQLKSYVSKNSLEDPRLSQIAREFMSLPDGRVKEAALDLMATQAPNPKNLDSVLRDIIGSFNEKLIPQALMELNKYPDPQSQKAIANAISENLSTGSFRVRQKLAEHSMNYINSSNYDHYNAISKNLPVNSVVKTHLDAALTEYRMKNSGG
ncbi:hypothetical protein GW916_12375 [bacterium]|nr:hypothetical protein [bacterium]